MSRLRIFYILSLVILGVLIASVVLGPVAVGEESSVVQRAHFLEAENQWIIEFDLLNKEGSDQSYIITFAAGSKQHTQNVLIRDGGMFTYIHHVYHNQVTDGRASVEIYKQGEETPFEQITFYLE